jgi:hypothetical protein
VLNQIGIGWSIVAIVRGGSMTLTSSSVRCAECLRNRLLVRAMTMHCESAARQPASSPAPSVGVFSGQYHIVDKIGRD